MASILIIEDDADIALLIRRALERDGAFEVHTAPDGETGLELARRIGPALVLLDLNLPGMDGLEVCRLLRADDEVGETALIMLTARTDEAMRVAGLELGADDYVSKPFSTRELVARVRAVLRRSSPSDDADEDRIETGSLSIDTAGRRVHVDGEEIELTRKEFDLLTELVRKRGRVLSRERLLENVWGYDHPGATRTVDVHVRQLRKKIGAELAERVETVVGVGYRFRTRES